MSKVGRNAPCPCGSGRKYKHCCLEDGLHGRYTVVDRESVRMRLQAVLDGPYKQTTAQALAVFQVLERRDYPADDPRFDELYLSSRDTFESWMFYDEPFEDDGRPLVEALLAPKVQLSPGERAYVTSVAHTAMRLYEVTRVIRGDSLTLRDLLVGGEVTVHDPIASFDAQRKDVLAARVIAAGVSGRPEFDSSPLLFRPNERDGLIDRVKQTIEAVRAKVPGYTIEDFLKRAGALYFHGEWLDMIDKYEGISDTRPPPLTGVLFTTNEPDRLIAGLDAMPELERITGFDRWRWHNTERESGPWKVYATCEVQGDELMLTAPTIEHAVRCRERLEEAFGSLISHRETSTPLDQAEAPGESPPAHA